MEYKMNEFESMSDVAVEDGMKKIREFARTIRKEDYRNKTVVFLADGMADEPLPELAGKTPVEAVDTPCLDSIALKGASGTFLTLPEGFPTSSDAANMSVMGYSLAQFYPGRGPIEAESQGIELKEDDIAWRCNVVYAEGGKEGILRDYSAGHISNEISSRLIADLKKHFDSDKVTFHPGVSYRNLLVLHGKEFSSNVDYYKPDSSQDIAVKDLPYTALDDSKEAAHTVAFINDLVSRASEFLAAHPLNQNVKSPANMIWPWSPGKKPSFTSFTEKYEGKTGAIISAVDVIKGIAKCAKMDVIEVPGATGFTDTDYEGKALAALKALKDHDMVYLHVEAIDECSHLGDLQQKMFAISQFENRLVKPVMEALEGCDVTFAILPDHPVPIHERAHTRTPVPVAVCGKNIPADKVKKYGESFVGEGALGAMSGEDFMRLVLGLK